ncbi:MAG: NADH-quinone oxidoreductase subunit J family protein [Microbacter sp.]
MFQLYLFIFLSVVALWAASMVLITKNPVHSVLYLTLTFFTLAGHYILLNAQFLAVVHVIVYAGAIMVLFLFTVMLLNLNKTGQFSKSHLMRLTTVIAGGLLFVVLVASVKSTDLVITINPNLSQAGLVKNLGNVLFTEYLLPFELSSILFLSAMVGAVMLGDKHKK